MINYGDIVEIVYQNTNFSAPESHPIHLHGFSFFLVGTGSGNFNSVTDPLSYNLDDPPELNTINLPKNGWAAIRFVADNPGKISTLQGDLFFLLLKILLIFFFFFG